MATNEYDAASLAAFAGSEIDLRGDQLAITSPIVGNRLYAMPATTYLRRIKPVIDRVVGSVALIVVMPMLVLIGIAVWAAMGSPVLLAQDRVGRYGRVFRLWKFRTMTPDRRTSQAERVGEERRQTHKSADDPRITPLGRWLRACRLDELPQFINVAVGDMSLVGPRPELVSLVAKYEPWQHRRHTVKPGVTGLWQISDPHGKLLFECTEMELKYLDEVSLMSDVKIMLATIPVIVRKTGI